jgi:hypothetical protein
MIHAGQPSTSTDYENILSVHSDVQSDQQEYPGDIIGSKRKHSHYSLQGFEHVLPLSTLASKNAHS